MKLKIQTHTSHSEVKAVLDRLTQENIENKLDWYLKTFDNNPDVEWIIDVKVKKTEKGYEWVLQINIDWKSFRYERDNYKNLDDLINNLFSHFKEELSTK